MRCASGICCQNAARRRATLSYVRKGSKGDKYSPCVVLKRMIFYQERFLSRWIMSVNSVGYYNNPIRI